MRIGVPPCRGLEIAPHGALEKGDGEGPVLEPLGKGIGLEDCDLERDSYARQLIGNHPGDLFSRRDRVVDQEGELERPSLLLAPSPPRSSPPSFLFEHAVGCRSVEGRYPALLFSGGPERGWQRPVCNISQTIQRTIHELTPVDRMSERPAHIEGRDERVVQVPGEEDDGTPGMPMEQDLPVAPELLVVTRGESVYYVEVAEAKFAGKCLAVLSLPQDDRIDGGRGAEVPRIGGEFDEPAILPRRQHERAARYQGPSEVRR
ncbi:hypothetical protein AMJ39_09070 [candidate division TA06 bacterium DG_24]|uniref:Uncharacterized protein n=3 Tax=Bacteria division TA06 TaxID=1156500 RepID=A0A0S8JKY4_UNCT6|nr:MAG: hypothetical protein AMJ39_09070 [candidate division TA06 bacterium DG_24]KPK66382.1 MAG: hypothetical protein AMJ82_11850 [candidate division TA06 bacterium SM23_40]KPL09484.1 MAG: hypothetical protein AMJ71_06330 [candidate division TA06 bacterium SM1_40]